MTRYERGALKRLPFCLDCRRSLPRNAWACPLCGSIANEVPRARYRLDAWRGAAEKWAGHYDADKDELLFFVDGARVTVSWVSNFPETLARTGHVPRTTPRAYLSARADFIAGVGPVFRVWRPGVFARVFTALGAGDIALGSVPEFDRQFLVRGRSREELIGTWTDDLQQMMLAKVGNAVAGSDGASVRVFRTGVADAGTLATFAAGLATARWRSLLKPLLRLPNASYAPPKGERFEEKRPTVTVPGNTLVSFDPVALAGDLRVRARTRLAGGAGLVAFDIDTTDEQGVAWNAIDETMRTKLRRLGQAQVKTVADSLEITWLERKPTEEHLLAGLELVRAMDVPKRGPYR